MELSVVEELTTAVRDLTVTVTELNSKIRISRRQIVVLTISLLLGAIAIIGVGFQVVQNKNQATQNKTSIYVSCVGSNQTRAQNIELWEFLLRQPRPKAATEAEEKATVEKLKAFRNFVHATFAPRVCVK